MKPTNVIDMKRTGDLGGDKVAMRFDENSIAHIMSVLTDLYSDSEMAVIREYSTNALDSHIMAGQSRPIEIVLPNAMNPYFKIRDFGLGMDTKTIEEVYSKYGASTKRDSNNQTGMLGLGCKSALTYTSQFMITAVKNSVKTIVVVSRVEDGTGVMEIVDTCPTTEVNGVEISIPVKQSNNFARKTAGFFRFWEPGTVLVDGAAPKFITGQSVNDEMMIVQSGTTDTDIIVMGGVPYPVESLFKGSRGYNSFNIVAKVDIGAITFTPSREALSTTTVTNKTLARLRDDFMSSLDKVVRAEIESQLTHAEALNKHIEWQEILRNYMPSNVFYRTEAIPLTWVGEFTSWNLYRTRYSMSATTRIDHQSVRDNVIVTSYDDKAITARHKQKLRAMMEERGLTARHAILCKTQPGLPWIKNDRVISWTDVLAYRLPTVARQASIPSYNVFTPRGSDSIKADEIDKTKPIFYVAVTQKVHPSNLVGLTKVIGDATIVELGDNRVEKFCREFPTAKRLFDIIQPTLKTVTDALTAADRINLGMDYYDKNVLSNLDESNVLDPALVQGIKTAKGLTTSDTIKKYQAAILVLKPFVNVPAISAASILGRYPLAQRSSGHTKHVECYLNAVYTATQNGEL